MGKLPALQIADCGGSKMSSMWEEGGRVTLRVWERVQHPHQGGTHLIREMTAILLACLLMTPFCPFPSPYQKNLNWPLDQYLDKKSLTELYKERAPGNGGFVVQSLKLYIKDSTSSISFKVTQYIHIQYEFTMKRDWATNPEEFLFLEGMFTPEKKNK